FGTWSRNTVVAPDGITNANGNTYNPVSWYYGNIFPIGAAALHNNINFLDSIMAYDTTGLGDTSLGTHGYFGVSGDNGLLLTIFPAFQNSTFSHLPLIAAGGPYNPGS